MSVPWEIPRPCELPAEVEEALINAVRTTKHANISLDEIAKLSLADAYLKTVVEDPHTRACVAWLTVLYPVFSPLYYGELDHNTDRVRNLSSMLLDRSKWRVDLDVSLLYAQFWRTLATPAIRPPIHNPLDGGDVVVPPEDCPPYPDPSDRPDRNPLLLTARAIADCHEAFFNRLRNSSLIAGGMPEGSYTMEFLSPVVWEARGLYLDVSSKDLFEGGAANSEPRPHRIYRQLRLSLPAGNAAPRRKGASNRRARLIVALKGKGIPSGAELENYTISKLAAELAVEVKGWENTDDPVESIRKMLERLKKKGFG
jgi:hypothetical protein